MENILNRAKSLYLVRHASNPVPWQIWDESVFQTAKRLNRPVFLSIGYSSCHWCRVMEKESFEDPETAAILADKFIPVKMDKDEYPDVDKEYQFYLQSTGEQGGWPLNVFLTPYGEPF
ncbi:MAG: thioredoxin domain-containing protein, partial [Mucispirillum sp.]|nr:thioredoxin domain-containing protein [Mucispirillum sp.]